jgi:hypothetical protein
MTSHALWLENRRRQPRISADGRRPGPAAQGAGDASAGKSLFEGKGRCLKCHAVNDAGGSLGPDLSWIGILRTPESLKRSLVDPSRPDFPALFYVGRGNQGR